MSTWSDFEVQCTDYLNGKFGGYADFIHQKGSDSTVSDILVKRPGSMDSFYIEVKHSPAQCGQFVLIPNLDTCGFEYSAKNSNPINDSSLAIMDYMNGSFDEFRNAGTRGKPIMFPGSHEVFVDWIIRAYKHKNARFFITNGYIIIPVEEFGDCFDVSATYRIKRSGSSSVGKRRIESVKDHVMGSGYDVTGFHVNRGKLYVYSTMPLHDHRFILDGTEYMFSTRDDRYEIRRLSNTYNANVIFSIQLRPSVTSMTDSEFIECLK